MRSERLLGVFLALIFGGSAVLAQTAVKCGQDLDICIALDTGDAIINGRSRVEMLKTALSNYLRTYSVTTTAFDDRVGVCLYNGAAAELFPLSNNMTDILEEISAVTPEAISRPSALDRGLKCCENMFSRGRFNRPDLTILFGLPDSVADLTLAQITAQEMKKSGHISVVFVGPATGFQATFTTLASNPSSVSTLSDYPTLLSDASSFSLQQAFASLCPVITNPCEDCEMYNGIGYMPGPDCWEYYQCIQIADRKVPILKKTAFGTFWDAERRILADPTQGFRCPNDRCQTLAAGSMYGRPDNCKMYMRCRTPSGYTGSVLCCPEGRRFVEGFGCVADASCTDTCVPNEIDPLVGCRSIAHPTDRKRFLADGRSYSCADGTVYDAARCSCVVNEAEFLSMVLPGDCEPEVDLTMSMTDISRNGYEVLNNGVSTIRTITGGLAASFQNSNLQIKGFSNNDVQDKFAIYIRFQKPFSSNFNAAIVSNADCAVGRETYAVVLNSVGGVTSVWAEVELDQVGRISTTPIALSLDPNEFSDVVMEYDGVRLAVLVSDSRGQFQQEAPGTGPITHQQPSCAMQIGQSRSFNDFRGGISKFKVFKCLRQNLADYIN